MDTPSSGRRYWFALAGALVLCIVALVVLLSGRTPSPTLTATRLSVGEVVLRYGAETAWFAGENGALVAEKAPQSAAALPQQVLEALPPNNGLYPVIALMPTSKGRVPEFGIADPSGAFLAIDTSNTFKEGLASNGGSLVAYAAFNSSAGISALNPSAAALTASSTSGSWELYTVDLSAAHPKPVALGEGSDPRFLKDGTILAWSTKGVVRINPANGERSVVVPAAAGGTVGSYASSPDLSYFALSSAPGALASSTLSVFALLADGTATQVASEHVFAYPIAFDSNGNLLTYDFASSTAAVYQMKSSGLSYQGMIPLTSQ